MSQFDDFNDYKLETIVHQESKYVQHSYSRIDRAHGFKKVEVIEKWETQEAELGTGTFGNVHLQQRIKETGIDNQYRAVKELEKSQLKRLKVDYKKELLALTKFSRSKVFLSSLVN